MSRVALTLHEAGAGLDELEAFAATLPKGELRSALERLAQTLRAGVSVDLIVVPA